MITLSFYGSGIHYWLCKIPDAEFEVILEYRKQTKKHWEEIFFDLDYLDKMGYENWENIHLLEDGKGWLIEEKNRIEIRNGKKKRLVKLPEFLGVGVLFDPFNKKKEYFEIESEVGYTNVMLIQVDAGLINKFVIDQDDLDLDKLTLTFNENAKLGVDLLWLTRVEYDGQRLFDKGEDCLTRQNIVRIL